MNPSFNGRRLPALATLLLGATLSLTAQTPAPSCKNCAEWNQPQKPFKLYGNTFYVGPHGLSAILITSPQGHILIDGDLPESARYIAANVRALGFRVEDIKFILNSHVHFDHAGGLGALQRLSRARVAASPWSAGVLRSGNPGRGDPQLGEARKIDPVEQVFEVSDGETLSVGPLKITAHFTPGHTPGGTSWTWTSCEGDRCLAMVYADSLSAVAANGWEFSQHPEVVSQLEASFKVLDELPCDLLITPHPDASDLWERVASGQLADPTALKRLVKDARQGLAERLAKEKSSAR